MKFVSRCFLPSIGDSNPLQVSSIYLHLILASKRSCEGIDMAKMMSHNGANQEPRKRNKAKNVVQLMHAYEITKLMRIYYHQFPGVVSCMIWPKCVKISVKK
jgi:hypothetical protein